MKVKDRCRAERPLLYCATNFSIDNDTFVIIDELTEKQVGGERTSQGDAWKSAWDEIQREKKEIK